MATSASREQRLDGVVRRRRRRCRSRRSSGRSRSVRARPACGARPAAVRRSRPRRRPARRRPEHGELVAAEPGDRVGAAHDASAERSPISCSMRSPAAWPRLSLTVLKSSRSMHNTAVRDGVARSMQPAPGGRARCNRARLPSPVSGSWVASYSSRPRLRLELLGDDRQPGDHQQEQHDRPAEQRGRARGRARPKPAGGDRDGRRDRGRRQHADTHQRQPRQRSRIDPGSAQLVDTLGGAPARRSARSSSTTARRRDGRRRTRRRSPGRRTRCRPPAASSMPSGASTTGTERSSRIVSWAPIAISSRSPAG